MAVLCGAAGLGSRAAADPLVYSIEGGGSYTHFTEDYGSGNTQFAAFTLTRPSRYAIRIDAGRAERFDDDGYGIGALLTKYLARNWSAGVGAGTGTGDFIHPEYRLDAFVSKGLLANGNLIATLGYAHEESKAANYYDRVAGSLTWWADAHWIFGGFYHYDIGYPGDTRTKSGGAGITWYDWQERSLSVSGSLGDVNYTQVGPTSFLVGYEEVSVSLGVTEYLSSRGGLRLKLDWGSNDFYDAYGVTVSLFRER